VKQDTITLKASQAYSIRQTAAIFQVKPLTITRWINSGKIAAYKEYRDWRISGAEIARVIQERGK
jgi:predicted site-specific integrase-resolvase